MHQPGDGATAKEGKSATLAGVPDSGSIVAEVAAAFERSGVDLGALGLAWARAMPAVTIVPAFGLRALPAPARAVIALALAGSVFPALAPQAALASGSTPWALLVLAQLARGLPIAIAAAVPLWAATMAGGVADALRGARETPPVPAVESGASPLGIPLSLLASAIFLATGGPARVALALVQPPAGDPVLAASGDILSGIALAVAIGAPLLAAAVVIEIAAALVARSAAPAQVHALLAPLRALGTLAVMAVVLERLATVLAKVVAVTPR